MIKRGFTLIETLVSISILTTLMVAPFFAVEQSITAADASRDELTGNALAQEGIEYVRNIRDDDYLYNRVNGTSRSWIYGVDGSGGSPDCFSSDGDKCTIDPTTSAGNQVQSYATSATLPVLYINSLYLYNEQSNGTPSVFTRSVQLSCTTNGACSPSTAQEVKVTVTVTWKTRSIPYTTTVTEYLENWLP